MICENRERWKRRKLDEEAKRKLEEEELERKQKEEKERRERLAKAEKKKEELLNKLVKKREIEKIEFVREGKSREWIQRKQFQWRNYRERKTLQRMKRKR